jgi:hypothetical protein
MATEWQCSRRIGVMPGEHLGYFPSLDEAKSFADNDIRDRAMEPRGDWQSRRRGSPASGGAVARQRERVPGSHVRRPTAPRVGRLAHRVLSKARSAGPNYVRRTSSGIEKLQADADGDLLATKGRRRWGAARAVDGDPHDQSYFASFEALERRRSSRRSGRPGRQDPQRRAVWAPWRWARP